MVVKLNPKSELAQLYTHDAKRNVQTTYDLFQQIKTRFDIEQIKVTVDKPIIHESLAPSFGDINNAANSVKELDDKMKLMIAISMRKLVELKYKNSLSWENIQACFNQNTSLVAESSPTSIVKQFTSKSTANFKFDGSPDPELVQRVMTWWEGEACPDPDIRNDSKLDVESLAKIVAWSGATITNLLNLLRKLERHERSMLEIGVLRYPTIAKPYFKLSRITLSAWSDCTRTVWHQEDKNGIKSTVTSQTFRPNDEVLAKVKDTTIKQAAREVDNMFLYTKDETWIDEDNLCVKESYCD